jgi:hypothetical protein
MRRCQLLHPLAYSLTHTLWSCDIRKEVSRLLAHVSL